MRILTLILVFCSFGVFNYWFCCCQSFRIKLFGGKIQTQTIGSRTYCRGCMRFRFFLNCNCCWCLFQHRIKTRKSCFGRDLAGCRTNNWWYCNWLRSFIYIRAFYGSGRLVSVFFSPPAFQKIPQFLFSRIISGLIKFHSF